MVRAVVILLVSLGLAVGVTIPKLYRMTQIKGWLPGAVAEKRTVTQKWRQTPDEHPDGRNTYWLAFTEKDIRQVGPHRTSVDAEYWSTLQVGDEIEVVRVRNDPRPYLRNGIFVSPGNFVFDVLLLAAELGAASAMVVRLRREARPPARRAGQTMKT